ncbi:SDR family oxidoreductase [Spiroplasma endosymbiont of Aspidapion aeneum]|uniref:SDR family oxidoreductase n=1 Tax=Spiroplasma endosymbiont of Aspidapion aeneum TaxID=3066276 RepID=UPI00313EFD60
MENNKICEKVIVITGAGGIICGGFARECAKNNFKIALLDIDIKFITILKDELLKINKNVIAIECNVLKKDSIIKACEQVIKEFSRIDILINGAGGNNPKATTTNERYSENDVKNNDVVSFFDIDPDGFKFVFDLNLIGTFLPTQVFAKHLLHKGASIINISSASAPHSISKVPAYSAAKAAIENLTQWLAYHFANTGLRVNAIAPGFFLTKQNEKLLINPDGSYTNRTKKVLAHTPMNRLGNVNELFGTLLYLINEEISGFVTGTTITVDGGFGSFSGV